MERRELGLELTKLSEQWFRHTHLIIAALSQQLQVFALIHGVIWQLRLTKCVVILSHKLLVCPDISGLIIAHNEWHCVVKCLISHRVSPWHNVWHRVTKYPSVTIQCHGQNMIFYNSIVHSELETIPSANLDLAIEMEASIKLKIFSDAAKPNSFVWLQVSHDMQTANLSLQSQHFPVQLEVFKLIRPSQY